MECIIPSNDAVKDTVLHCTYPGTVEQNSAMWTAIAGIAIAIIALGILIAALAAWRLLRNRTEGQQEQLEHDAFMRYVQEMERVSSSAGTPDDSFGGTRRTELRSNLRLAWYGWGLHLKGAHPGMYSLTERLADATADLAAEFDRWEGQPLPPHRVQEYNAMFGRFRDIESGITVALADWKLDASARQPQEQRLEGAWSSLNGLKDELVRWGETAAIR
ncbi:hypothetical protein GCM10023081_41490 [Arthrobacter ginkgonis]|uniref:Uncharacterized protein n=2 Tax=Arthrobacter ginkgonis TaxID=1630594 RepID=A0ABP7D976_9MICC